jgi:hypothetical protein
MRPGVGKRLDEICYAFFRQAGDNHKPQRQPGFAEINGFSSRDRLAG